MNIEKIKCLISMHYNCLSSFETPCCKFLTIEDSDELLNNFMKYKITRGSLAKKKDNVFA